MNYIYCSDLKNYQVFGTFIEALYHLNNVLDGNILPLVIVGDRDADKLDALQQFVSKTMGIDGGIFTPHFKLIKHDNIDNEVETLLHEVSTVEDLQKVKYQGIALGIGIASSIISAYRCTQPDLSQLQNELKAYTRQAILFTHAFQNIIDTSVSDEDTLYIYNGRHYNTYPQSLICENAGITTYYYERMNSWKNLKIQKARIHDLKETAHIAKLFCQEQDTEQLKVIGEKFYLDNLSNKFTHSFSAHLNIDTPYVSFFVSSEDEFASLDPRIKLSDIFDSQREAFEWLAEWISKKNGCKLVVRLHPNQSETGESDFNYWHDISGPNIILIPSTSSIDSYKLIKNSSKVISYLSTVGIEATRAGVPSITLGNPPYSGLNAVYEPASKEEIANLLNDIDLPAKPKENTLPYGFYNVQYGPQLKYFKEIGLTDFTDYARVI